MIIAVSERADNERARAVRTVARRARRSGLDVVTDLGHLEPAWRRLEQLRPTPMQAWSWAAATEQVYGPSERLVALVVGDRDDPAAIAPLRLQRKPGIQLALKAHNEPADFLYADERALEALCVGIAGLRLPVAFLELNSDSLTLRRLQVALAGRGLTARRYGACPVVDLDDTWREPERTLNSRRRSDLRRARRRAEELGHVTAEVLQPASDGLPRLLDEAVAVEAAGWKGRTGTALAADPRYQAFFRTWADLAARDGVLRLAFLRIDGRAVAAQIATVLDDRLWLLKIGYDESVARCSPGNLLMLEVIRHAATQGLRAVEFLGGAEAWTQLWASRTTPWTSLACYPAVPASLTVGTSDVVTAARRSWRVRGRRS